MKKFVLGAIRFYQKNISAYTPPTCRFYPTCSAYAYKAITQFGVLKGGWLAAKRILKCNPFFPGGFDPVPEEFTFFAKKDKD